MFFTVTFDKFNASLLNKCVQKSPTDPKHLYSVYCIYIILNFGKKYFYCIISKQHTVKSYKISNSMMYEHFNTSNNIYYIIILYYYLFILFVCFSNNMNWGRKYANYHKQNNALQASFPLNKM